MHGRGTGGMERRGRVVRRREMRRSNQRTVLGVVGAGLIVAAVVVLAAQEGATAQAASVPLLTWVLGGLGAYMVIAALPWDSD